MQDHRAFLIEAWNLIDGQRRLDAIEEYFAPDFVRHAGDGTYSRDEFRDLLATLYGAVPDLKWAIVDSVAEGDRVAYRWTSEGTHLGTYLGVPATHRRIAANGITISRFDADGRIAEDWASWNQASVLHSLGIIPID
jgi:steroid delta-isomerase-like uncharacterized protein